MAGSQAVSALHMMAVLQDFHAKMDKEGLDPATNLVLRATKMMVVKTNSEPGVRPKVRQLQYPRRRTTFLIGVVCVVAEPRHREQ